MERGTAVRSTAPCIRLEKIDWIVCVFSVWPHLSGRARRPLIIVIWSGKYSGPYKRGLQIRTLPKHDGGFPISFYLESVVDILARQLLPAFGFLQRLLRTSLGSFVVISGPVTRGDPCSWILVSLLPGRFSGVRKSLVLLWQLHCEDCCPLDEAIPNPPDRSTLRWLISPIVYGAWLPMPSLYYVPNPLAS